MRILLRAGYSPLQAAPANTPSRAGFGNSGNILFSHSVFKGLYKHQNQIDIDGYDPEFASPEEINERYDAYVLPMANAFRPEFEAVLGRYTALIRRLKIPCIVVGVGAQAGLDLAELRGAPMDATVKDFASAVLDRSPAIGVRGEHSRDYLNRLGFNAIDIIGCPSMFFCGAEFSVLVKRPEDSMGLIAVNHGPGADAASAGFARSILASYPNSTFIAQETANAQAWSAIVSEKSSLGQPHRVRHFREIAPWLAFMRTRSFSIGTRIHGNIAALLAGVPAVVIVHDSRTREIARHHRIPHLLAGTVTADSELEAILASVDVSPTNTAAGPLLDHFKAFLEKSGLDHAYDDPRNAAEFERRVTKLLGSATDAHHA